MHHDLFEFSTCGELRVDMQPVKVAAEGGEGVDVFTTDGLADAGARSDLEQREGIAAVVSAETALPFGLPAWSAGGFLILTFQH